MCSSDLLVGIAQALGVPVQEILSDKPMGGQDSISELVAGFQALDAQDQHAVKAMIDALAQKKTRR